MRLIDADLAKQRISKALKSLLEDSIDKSELKFIIYLIMRDIDEQTIIINFEEQ